MTTSSTTGQTDFTGIVNAVQMLTQMVGQNNKTINAIAAQLEAGTLPPPALGNALDMIRVNAAGTAYEVRTPTQVVSDLGLSNAVPIGTSNTTTGTTISVTTTTFTAPSPGVLVLLCDGAASAGITTGASITTSLAGFVSLYALFGNGAIAHACGYLPMSAMNSSTATFSVTTSTSATINANIMAFFLPQA